MGAGRVKVLCSNEREGSISVVGAVFPPGGTTFTTHVRAICAFGYNHDTAPFTVSLGTGDANQDSRGFPQTVDIGIIYSTGRVIAYGVAGVTAGSSVGKYNLHTANGETYTIDDTIPAYIIEGST